MRLVVLFVGMLCAGSAWAEGDAPPIALAISGRVGHPVTLSADDLAAAPQATVPAPFDAGHGPQSVVFSGPLLLALITNAAPIDEPGERTGLQHVIIARGRDGYGAAVAIGELDPRFEGKTAIVATAQDGKPLPALRLIIPGDHHAGRAVRDLVGLEMR